MVSKIFRMYFRSSWRPAGQAVLKAGVAVLGLVSLWGADALAQTSCRTGDKLEEITVTARKREEIFR